MRAGSGSSFCLWDRRVRQGLRSWPSPEPLLPDPGGQKSVSLLLRMAEEGTPVPKNKGGEQGVCFASMEKRRIKVEYLCNEPQGVQGSQSLLYFVNAVVSKIIAFLSKCI